MILTTHELGIRSVSTQYFRGPTLLFCRKGTLWITRSGDATDYLVMASKAVTFPPGEWLVQALEDAVFEFSTPISTKEDNEDAYEETRILPAFYRL